MTSCVARVFSRANLLNNGEALAISVDSEAGVRATGTSNELDGAMGRTGQEAAWERPTIRGSEAGLHSTESGIWLVPAAIRADSEDVLECAAGLDCGASVHAAGIRNHIAGMVRAMARS